MRLDDIGAGAYAVAGPCREARHRATDCQSCSHHICLRQRTGEQSRRRWPQVLEARGPASPTCWAAAAPPRPTIWTLLPVGILSSMPRIRRIRLSVRVSWAGRWQVHQVRWQVHQIKPAHNVNGSDFEAPPSIVSISTLQLRWRRTRTTLPLLAAAAPPQSVSWRLLCLTAPGPRPAAACRRPRALRRFHRSQTSRTTSS